MVKKIQSFIKKEAVLCISALCAIISMFFVLPSKEYIGYIDFRVLCLLFCLMTVVAGFSSCGIFKWLTYKLLSKDPNGKILSVILVCLPFFSSMLVTNDVALLVFVPFTIGLLNQINAKKSAAYILVLQTIAANLGSMATPIGNPQNLYIYANYNLEPSEFFAVMLPVALVSFVLIIASCLPILPKALPKIELKNERLKEPKKLIVYFLLFILSLVTVFRLVPYLITTLILIVSIFFTDRKTLKKADFSLLLTFVCFFIVSGNLGNIEEVHIFLQNLLSRNTLLTSVGTSQIISNVPAAVLLSGFTENWRELLEGVNIGGLGTPIASLASLITLKLYINSKGSSIAKFLLIFTLANFIMLLLLCVFVGLY